MSLELTFYVEASYDRFVIGGIMKPVALLSVFVILLLGTNFAQAQGFRAPTGGGGWAATATPSRSAVGRSATTSMSWGGVSGQAGQQSQGFRGSAIQPPIQSSPRFQSQSFSPQPKMIQRHWGGRAFVPPPSVRPWPPFVLGRVPHHSHRHWFFHRHPRVFIIDVPYVVGTPVITQIAPGVVSADRRYLDGPPSEARMPIPGQLAPFDPTPQEVVERMLTLAAIKKDDVIYDLGSGDGRILITAAKKFGIRGLGFEIDPGLVKLARENAREQGVTKLVEFRQQDFLSADLSPASVVMLYLSRDGNLAVRQQLMQQLKPGARVVSYTFDMGEWQPKIIESYRDAAGDTHVIHLWQIGEPMVFSGNSAQILQPQPTRNGPLVIEVK
jgi:precorrin-6B methylase 2